MSDYAIRVNGLGKRYRVGRRRPSLLSRLRLTPKPANVAAAPADEGPDSAEFWALKDICFDIKHGEAVGIIGRNGAGKSTLLKILSGITEPTKGRAEVNGRVGSLLEVGTGFHPDLTGRENIFLNGALLGMRRGEIQRKFDEIVAFSELEKFIDTAVKHYSSGMYMRLAFAIAAHLEPEILIVDEVLAVGDAAFQRKCIGKMGVLTANEGRTIIFVSHNTAALSSICSQGILLERGRVQQIAAINDVLHHYVRPESGNVFQWSGNIGDDNVRLLRTWLRAAEGVFHTAGTIEIGVEVDVLRPFPGLILGFRLFSEFDTELAYVLYDDREDSPSPVVPAGRLVKHFVIPPNILGHGNYRIGFVLGIHGIKAIMHDTHGSLTFSLSNISGIGRRFPLETLRGFTGILRPDWTSEKQLVDQASQGRCFRGNNDSVFNGRSS